MDIHNRNRIFSVNPEIKKEIRAINLVGCGHAAYVSLALHRSWSNIGNVSASVTTIFPSTPKVGTRRWRRALGSDWCPWEVRRRMCCWLIRAAEIIHGKNSSCGSNVFFFIFYPVLVSKATRSIPDIFIFVCSKIFRRVNTRIDVFQKK